MTADDDAIPGDGPEVALLRAQLRAAQAEIARLRHLNVVAGDNAPVEDLRGEILRRQLARFQDGANGSPMFVWGWSRLTGRFWLNNSLMDLLGLDDHEHDDPFAGPQFVPRDRNRLAAAWGEAVRTSSPIEEETLLRTADGSLRSVILSGFATGTDEDGAIGFVGSVTDVTRRRSVEARLRQLNRELEGRVETRTAELRHSNQELAQRNAELDRFASATSHDMRAPLRAIIAFTGVLRDELEPEQLTPAAADALRRVQGAAVRMRSLIDSLLELSRATRIELATRPVDLDRCLDDAIENLGITDASPEVRLVRAPLPKVLGDPVLLPSVFQNVLANSIRYRGDGQVTVHITSSRANDLIQIDIVDDGVGFDPRHAERIFEPFERLDAAPDRGSGLGLAICAQIIRRHGGAIWACSRPGGGTTVSFTLPAAP